MRASAQTNSQNKIPSTNGNSGIRTSANQRMPVSSILDSQVCEGAVDRDWSTRIANIHDPARVSMRKLLRVQILEVSHWRRMHTNDMCYQVHKVQHSIHMHGMCIETQRAPSMHVRLEICGGANSKIATVNHYQVHSTMYLVPATACWIWDLIQVLSTPSTLHSVVESWNCTTIFNTTRYVVLGL